MESMFLGIEFPRAIDEANEKMSVSRDAKSSRRKMRLGSVQQYRVSRRRTSRKVKNHYGFHNATMFARGSDRKICLASAMHLVVRP